MTALWVNGQFINTVRQSRYTAKLVCWTEGY